MDTKELKNNVASIDSAIEKLLEITKTKQTVLIQRNHEELNNLIEKEQQLLNTLSHLSKHQKSLTNSIKIEFNIDEDTNSLTDILEYVSKNISLDDLNRLKSLLQNINEKSKELQKINEQNKMLIEASRVFIKGIIQSVRGSANSSLINRRM